MLTIAPPKERMVVIVIDTRRKANKEMGSDVDLLPVLGIEAVITDERISREMLVYSEKWADGLAVVGQLCVTGPQAKT
jgi:hypothetical protein